MRTGVALDMIDAGVEVAAIADLRPDATPAALAEKIAAGRGADPQRMRSLCGHAE